MTKRLEIIFGKDGSITSEGHDFKGPECVEKRAFLDKEFGDPKSVVKKSSFNDLPNTIANGLPSGHCGQGAIMDLPKHTVKCGGQDCPFCEAGFPRKMVIPFFDWKNGIIYYLSVKTHSKIAKMLYGEQWNPRKEITK